MRIRCCFGNGPNLGSIGEARVGAVADTRPTRIVSLGVCQSDSLVLSAANGGDAGMFRDRLDRGGRSPICVAGDLVVRMRTSIRIYPARLIRQLPASAVSL